MSKPRVAYLYQPEVGAFNHHFDDKSSFILVQIEEKMM